VIALEDFFIGYGKQDLQAGELVWQIEIPKLAKHEAFSCFKISKRFDQDISAVMAAFKFTLEGHAIKSARIAFGGMAATPKRAKQTEAALVGLRLEDAHHVDTAILALAQDFAPISDMRASAEYRMTVAQNLLRKAILDIQGKGSAAIRVHRVSGVAQ
jgi:xanthine dehydrogenase small subunit